MLCKLFSCTLVAAALGEITWTPTNLRRTNEIELSKIKSDADCMVAWYDSENLQKIFVGGPCSELSETMAPSPNFRWVEMQSVNMRIMGSDGAVEAFQNIPDSAFVEPSQNVPESASVYPADAGGAVEPLKNVPDSASVYSEDRWFGWFNPEDESAQSGVDCNVPCGIFTPDYTMNSFVVELEADKTGIKGVLAQCVAPSGCPTQAVPGAYKFSIMAAAYNFSDVMDNPLVAGVSGNGSEKVVETVATGTPGSKTLAGVSMDYYQVIDFSNMEADTLTVTAPGGTSTKYADMTACDLSPTSTTACNDAVEVKSMTVGSDGGWSASYAFPQTSNVGSWTSAAHPQESQTRKVQIHCIKPNGATLVSLGVAADTTAAAQKRVVLVRYRFDIAGMTANATTGVWTNYHPTITSFGTTTAGTSAALMSGGAALTGTTTGVTPAATRNAPIIV